MIVDNFSQSISLLINEEKKYFQRLSMFCQKSGVEVSQISCLIQDSQHSQRSKWSFFLRIGTCGLIWCTMQSPLFPDEYENFFTFYVTYSLCLSNKILLMFDLLAFQYLSNFMCFLFLLLLSFSFKFLFLFMRIIITLWISKF